MLPDEASGKLKTIITHLINHLDLYEIGERLLYGIIGQIS
jgi:hypothetical protein